MSSAQKITSLGVTFDATQVAPQQAAEAVPLGWYSVNITDGEIKPTEGGNGKRIALEWTITEGQYKGRKVFDGFNIIHSNADAQRIAAGQVSAICHATQTFQLTDVSQLFNKPHQIKAGVEAGRWVDADNNEVEVPAGHPAGTPPPGAVKYYEARNVFKGAKSGSAPAAAAPTGAPGAAAPAWAATNTTTPAQPAATSTASATAAPPWAVTAAPAGNAAPAATNTPPPANSPSAAAPGTTASKPATKPKKPAGKPAAQAPAAEAPKVERKFFVGIDAPEFAAPVTESKLCEYFAKGMPADTPLCLEGESDYKTAKEYGVGAPPATAPQPAPTPAPVTAAAPAAAAPAGNLPPWAR